MKEKSIELRGVSELTPYEMSTISGGIGAAIAGALAARMIWAAMQDPNSVWDGFVDALT